jgi:anhydro-N-acetylmuramic acid kinase
MHSASATHPDIYLGIMTGTSLDAIDVAACRFHLDSMSERAESEKAEVELVEFSSTSWPKTMREILMTFATESNVSMDLLARTHFAIAKYYANAVQDCLTSAKLTYKEIRAIGLHGQTIRHLPAPVTMAEISDIRATFQLGSGSALAALSQIDVVSDFRSADVALGGQGAPLVPMFDYAFLRSNTTDRLMVNIGGISNVTWIPRSATRQDVRAFDCGPGNMLMDAVTRKYFGEPFDRNGDRARSGIIDEALLAELHSHPYFSLIPPKSTGRETFGESFLDPVYENIERKTITAADALATLAELTARSIVESIPIDKLSAATEFIVSGGGAYNNYLFERIKNNAHGRKGVHPRVLQSDALGIPANAKEAIAFAFFAKAFLEDIPIHLPETTGAKRVAKLGSLSCGSIV